MRLMLDTGFPRADVENDFLRARRRQFLATLAHRLPGRRGDGNRLMVLDDVVGPLGWRGQRQLGLQTIQLDTIVGSPSCRWPRQPSGPTTSSSTMSRLQSPRLPRSRYTSVARN